MSAVEAGVAAALRRAAVYRLLAQAFAYPTPARLEAIAAAGAEVIAPDTRARLAGLADAAACADSAALAAEYVELFDRAVPCPPYEGAYGTPQMSGKSAQLADVAGFYAAFGLAPGAWQPDLEDHIGAELDRKSVV